MNIVSRKIDKLGRMVLPMDFRKVLGHEGEADVVLGINDNSITVRKGDASCKLCYPVIEVTKSLGICSECIKRIKKT